MPRSIAEISAINFHDPLLLALGDLTGFVEGKIVRARDVYLPTMERAGVESMDAYGYMDSNNRKKPWVKRWIQMAHRDQRGDRDGHPAYTKSGGRGKYALTKEGVKRARKLRVLFDNVPKSMYIDDAVHIDDEDYGALAEASPIDRLKLDRLVSIYGDADPEDAVEAEPSEPVEPKASWADEMLGSFNKLKEPSADPEEEVEEEPPAPEPGDGALQELGEGVQLPEPNKAPISTDPYIVGLYIERTKCFGSWNPRSSICDNCPLAQACLRKVQQKLSQIASDLDNGTLSVQNRLPGIDDDVEAAEAANVEADEGDKGLREERVEEFRSLLKQGTTPTSFLAPTECFCELCGEKIPEATSGVFIASYGPMHKSCARKAKEAA